jgi:hypothetical protein
MRRFGFDLIDPLERTVAFVEIFAGNLPEATAQAQRRMGRWPGCRVRPATGTHDEAYVQQAS